MNNVIMKQEFRESKEQTLDLDFYKGTFIVGRVHKKNQKTKAGVKIHHHDVMP